MSLFLQRTYLLDQIDSLEKVYHLAIHLQQHITPQLGATAGALPSLGYLGMPDQINMINRALSNGTPLMNTVPGMLNSHYGPFVEAHPPPTLPWVNGGTLDPSQQQQNHHNHVGGSNVAIQPSAVVTTRNEHNAQLTTELEIMKKTLSQVTNEMAQLNLRPPQSQNHNQSYQNQGGYSNQNNHSNKNSSQNQKNFQGQNYQN
jgi:hypothetical protein